jgi:signal transduction histidine kinase
VSDEVSRLGKLLRRIVWGQLAVFSLWAIATTVLDPATAPFRLSMLALLAVISVATVQLERRGHLTAAAVVLVIMMWVPIAARVLVTGSVSHGAWFLIAVLVGVAGLFLGARVAIITIVVSAAFGALVINLVDAGVIAPGPQPGPWLDWVSGLLVFSVIAILEVSAVHLYRGGLELARKAAHRHRALFDNAPIAIYELDLHDAGAALERSPAQLDEAIARATTTDVNDTAVRLVGGTRADVLRVGIQREVLAKLIDALVHKQANVDAELELELAGQPRRVVVRAELTDDLHHVIVCLADVTDARRLAEQLHDARRLETVASLAGSVAHDFNNLLTVSQLNLDRISKKVAALANSREVERIRDANTRAATLTRQLLVFSRRDVPHRQVFAPDRVLANLEPVLRRTLDERIEIVVKRGGADAVVDMDPAQLELLVTNLVYNAADAITERGTLRITQGRRTIGADGGEDVAPGDYISIAVSDTGRGMTPEARTRAFEPFFTTRPGKRAGLGLAIVRRIVREAAGTIVVESAPETGTRIEVLLPAATPTTTSFADATAGTERILLVEDDDGLREVARTTLEEAGYAVVAVRNGNEALVSFANGAGVDLVVSDLVMPGIGGRELVDRLRTTRPSLPVLYVSGHAADGPPVLDGDKRVAFLAKPFTARELLVSVRSVLPIGSP